MMLGVALFLQAVLWLSIVAVHLRGRHSSIYHPLLFYLGFHGLVFVAYPIASELLEFQHVQDTMGFFPTDTEKMMALLVSSVGLIVFAITSSAAGRPPLGFPERAPLGSRSDVIALGLTWLLLAPFAIYSAWFGIGGSTFGGTGNVQMDLVDNIAVYTNTTGYVVDANQMLLPLSVMTILFAPRKLIAYVPATLFFLYRVFMGWGRWTIVTLCLMLMLTTLWRQRRRWPHRRTAAIVSIVTPIVFGVFLLLGENRSAVRDVVAAEQGGAAMPADPSFKGRLDKPDFANFAFLTYVVATVPEKTLTYTYGSQYLQIFTEPIPRIMWSSKPYGPPIKLFDLNDYANFLGLTVSLPGDGWQNGGWIGLVITMAFAGFVLGRIHHWFWRTQGSTTRSLFYLMLMSVSFQLFRDGGITIFKFLLFTTIPIFAWGMIRGIVERYRRKSMLGIPGVQMLPDA